MTKSRDKRVFFRIGLFLIGYFISGGLFAETFKVGVYDSPPLVFSKKSTLLGIYKEIFSEISKITSDTFEFDYGTATQIVNRFNKGKIDIEPGINPLWRHAEEVPGLYSIPFSKSSSIVVSLKPTPSKSKKEKQPSIKAKALKTGLIKGYEYSNLATHFKDNAWEPVLAESETQLLNLLNNKKIDQAVIDASVMDFFLRSQNNKNTDKYVLSKPLDTQSIMMRVHPDKASAIPRFNDAIKKLIDDGTIKKIYNRYGLTE